MLKTYFQRIKVNEKQKTYTISEKEFYKDF